MTLFQHGLQTLGSKQWSVKCCSLPNALSILAKAAASRRGNVTKVVLEPLHLRLCRLHLKDSQQRGYGLQFLKLTSERGKRLLPLPQNIVKEAVLEILHNHQLLVRAIWPHFAIMSSEETPNETVYALETPRQAANVKATLTNIDGGMFLLQELELEISFLTSWTVTDQATEGQKSGENKVAGYNLEEAHTIQGLRLLHWMHKLSGVYSPFTNCLMELLRDVAAKEEFSNHE